LLVFWKSLGLPVAILSPYFGLAAKSWLNALIAHQLYKLPCFSSFRRQYFPLTIQKVTQKATTRLRLFGRGGEFGHVGLPRVAASDGITKWSGVLTLGF